VLLGNTAVPSWNAAHKQLPFVFAGSALAVLGGITMIFTRVHEAGPLRKAAVAEAAVEMAAMHRVEKDHGILSKPYHEGQPGRTLRAAKAVTAAGAGLTVPAGRTSAGQIASEALPAARTLLTRFGVFEAGMASARDPKYTVVSQRGRLAARQSEEHAPTVTP
jgi:hypothetical protein